MTAQDLTGRTAIVTGGGRNIGRALALGFAAAGANVAIVDTLGAEADAVRAEIEKAGGSARAFDTDISDEVAIRATVDAVAADFGGVDILVNNAALFSALGYQDFQAIPQDEWRRVLEVNVTGTFNCVRGVEAHMRRGKWGRIVNVSSGSIRMGRPHFLHYVSSKAALVGMSRSLARELGPHGITVNTLLPGVVFTGTQKGRLDETYQNFILSNQCIPEAMEPEAMVGPVLFLCSDAARFVTGQELAVDGGLTHGG
jgi:NAD(P)-dependent dehydrogenase (short-subunit alcohol dehydrogenase family)